MGSKILNFFKRLSVTKKVILCILAFLVTGYIFCLPRHLFHVPYSTVVTDRNEELLGARIASDGQWRFPPRNTTPEKIKECLITFEDKHFYHHWGVNPFAIGRAFYQNVKNKRIVSGGSTLTMQTIRLARNESRTFREKLIEMIWATRLEFRASKEEILSMYISHAPFGGNVVGLDAAAWRYFGHSADDLSWAESAMLAVLPNAPAMIHLSKGRKTLLDKRNRLLKQLLEKKTIDSSTYELAISEPLPDEPHPLPQIAPYLVSRFYQERNGEYSRSTINKGIQTQIEDLAERWSNEFRRSDIRNLAILVIDIPSNQVVAYCGNVHFDQKQGGNQVDVIQAPRSTGSILKPFLYYAMLQEGSLLPDMLLPDVPVNINGFTPQNFSMQFEGAVPASEALARSLNIPAVTMLQRYGVPKFHSFLQQIGLKTINRSSFHYGLSLILGGAEATLWDVTNAYAMMGRSLLQLPQRSCSLLLPTSRITESTDPFQPGAVWQTFDALKEVNRPEEIDWKSIPSMQTIAWKTGTSYGFRDAWAVGVTPRYAVGVWVGNATGEGKPGLVGAQTAGPVLFDIFNLLPASSWFTRPTGIFVEAEVCRKSGHLKGRFCDETDTLLVLPAGLRTEACPYHHLVTLSADESQRIYENCANTEPTLQKSWFTLPPVWEWYYKQHHPEYKPLPPFKAGCGEDTFQPMQFIYPPMNARIKLPKQLDGSKGFLTVELAHSNPNATIFWHLDETYQAQTQDFHKISLQPAAGKHSLTAVDGEGNTISTTFFVE
ncbi:penicillin-binding protein 1C [Bacteroides thetaiotaomicron]|uniref:peptidoglycan glycosyltransferase n=1 Tax=Bacteroides thetaiotaomicron TaxID=818 RepID=A0A6I0PJJ5_BACT4|nr:penicillin-binding protein 1C [Bacteroides thetaiotaomicron]KAB4269391.1 penicillin-binding protein 1C [Bacteroides thetaiotaomicron]KAB4274458.1 penicillin-binding protein 1C [Bacteroides thetaiotaomicron]KAB4282294.1 penicillin-binding protein 1C [Bacteroides thetaiotaomicron]KAB4288073.1 penicillin-binding protein 1C [Bacteroides thetaiotaomicron]KAB4302850.1 penicillin-binding protein 1C [Bacteroides thetaiotaomicron]